MQLAYDRAGDLLVLQLGDLATSVGAREVAPGVYLDFNAAGQLLGLEVLSASSHWDRAALEGLAGLELGLMGLPEAAATAGLTPIALRKACERGTLKAHKVGRDWLVSDSELAAYRRRTSRRRRRPSGKGAL